MPPQHEDDPRAISLPYDFEPDPQTSPVPMSQPRSTFHRLLRPKRAATSASLPRGATVASLPASRSALVRQSSAGGPTASASAAAAPSSPTAASHTTRRGRASGGTCAPVAGSRVPTCDRTRAAKAALLATYPGLSITRPSDGAQRAVCCGLNALRAEALDLGAMVCAMEAYATQLSHDSVHRFYAWVPPFAEFCERALQLDDQFLLRPLEDGTLCASRADAVPLPGALRPRVRMRMRGELRRVLADLIELEAEFTPNLPAGQRLKQLSDLCHRFLGALAAVAHATEGALCDALRARARPRDVDRLPVRVARHVVAHTGYKEFLAMYTRWMGASALREWKACVLLPVDYKFFSYAAWERAVDGAHYSIAAGFYAELARECDEGREAAEQTRIDQERAEASRKAMEKRRGETLGPALRRDSDDEDVDGDDEDGEYVTDVVNASEVRAA